MTDAVTPAAIPEPMPEAPPRSRWADVWRQFRTHRGAFWGMVFLVFITLFVTVGPLIYPHDPTALDIRNKDLRPFYIGMFAGEDSRVKWDWAHPLGTDNLGRDLMAKLMLGGQVSLAVGWVAMLLALFLGALVGVVAGFFKKLDGPLMRLTDLFLALPLLPLLLVMMLLFREPLRANFGTETGTFLLIVVVIGITSWMQTARIVRGDVLALKEREFIMAARSIGTPNGKIISRHLLPNVMSAIMVSATLGLANAIITESAISFLGLGFPPDFPTWGKLLSDATDRLQRFPERVIWPGIAISFTVLAVNYMGDGLRDALDPRIRGR